MPAKYRGLNLENGGLTSPCRIIEAQDLGCKLFRHQVYPFNTEWYLNGLAAFDNYIATPGTSKYILVFHHLQETAPDIITPHTFWDTMAKKYRKHPRILGYDLFNEPDMTESKANKLQKELHAIIRKHDKTKKIFISSAYGDPTKIRKVNIIDDPNVYYTVHSYWPTEFTAQGINGIPTGVPYPSSKYNKDSLIKLLAPVRKFQLNNKVKIFMGEFSASIFCDEQSRVNYIRDCISIFNRYGWLWAYHCWRTTDGVWEPSSAVIDVLKEGWS